MKELQIKIHLALAFDENFIIPLNVLLTSIFDNNSHNKNIIIHAIATGIDNQEKNKIKEYVNLNKGEIYFYEIDKSYNLDKLDTPYLRSTGWTVATYYRLFFPFLVPDNVKKLLYVDTDTVVLRSLESLYTTDISPFPVGAAPDIAMLRNNDPRLIDLGVEKENYFNAGVLLIDTDQWKQQKILERTLKYILENETVVKFPDQDALNHVLINNYYRLSNLYNFCWDDISIHLPKKEILKNEITILHYTGIKPWKGLNANRLRSFYYDYLKKSPYKNTKKYIDFKWEKSYIFKFIKIRILEFYLDHPLLRRAWNKIKSNN
jgi:lipopolysaccharide biosynthesis glycosyltransferase